MLKISYDYDYCNSKYNFCEDKKWRTLISVRVSAILIIVFFRVEINFSLQLLLEKAFENS